MGAADGLTYSTTRMINKYLEGKESVRCWLCFACWPYYPVAATCLPAVGCARGVRTPARAAPSRGGAAPPHAACRALAARQPPLCPCRPPMTVPCLPLPLRSSTASPTTTSPPRSSTPAGTAQAQSPEASPAQPCARRQGQLPGAGGGAAGAGWNALRRMAAAACSASSRVLYKHRALQHMLGALAHTCHACRPQCTTMGAGDTSPGARAAAWSGHMPAQACSGMHAATRHLRAAATAAQSSPGCSSPLLSLAPLPPPAAAAAAASPPPSPFATFAAFCFSWE